MQLAFHFAYIIICETPFWHQYFLDFSDGNIWFISPVPTNILHQQFSQWCCHFWQVWDKLTHIIHWTQQLLNTFFYLQTLVSPLCFFSPHLTQHHWLSSSDPVTLTLLFWIDIYWYSLSYQFSKLFPNIWLNGDHCLHLSDPILGYQYLFQFVAFHQNFDWCFCGKLLVLNALHMAILWIDIAQVVDWKWLILCFFH